MNCVSTTKFQKSLVIDNFIVGKQCHVSNVPMQRPDNFKGVYYFLISTALSRTQLNSCLLRLFSCQKMFLKEKKTSEKFNQHSRLIALLF